MECSARNTAALIIGVLAAAASVAESTPEAKARALNSASQELIECAAYFGIVAQGLRRTTVGSTQDAAKRYEAFKEEALIYAVKIEKSMRPQSEPMDLRLKNSIDSMLDEMGRDYINVDVLMDRYGPGCKTALEDPTARINYWIARHGT